MKIDKNCPIKDLTSEEIFDYLYRREIYCPFCKHEENCHIYHPNCWDLAFYTSPCFPFPDENDELGKKVEKDTRDYIVDSFKDEIICNYGENATLSDFEKDPYKILYIFDRETQLALLKKIQGEKKEHYGRN